MNLWFSARTRARIQEGICKSILYYNRSIPVDPGRLLSYGLMLDCERLPLYREIYRGKGNGVRSDPWFSHGI